jgi:hypothetical protein
MGKKGNMALSKNKFNSTKGKTTGVSRAAKWQKEREISEIRVTRIPKSERKEKEVTRLPLRQPKKSENEKLMKALRKKLTSVELLMKREADGEELDEQQMMKVAKIGELMEQLQELTALESKE